MKPWVYWLGWFIGWCVTVPPILWLLAGRTDMARGGVLHKGAGDVVKLTDPGNAGEVLTSNGAGTDPAFLSGSIAIQRAVVTLTDAQIKALPTTPVTLVAAPGAGFQVRLMATTLSIDTTAGAYTNINATYADLHGTNYTMYGLVDDSTTAPPLTVVSQFLGAAGKVVYQVSVPNQVANGPYVQNISVLGYAGVSDVPLELFMDNNGSGNLTGGNAANSLKVTVYYVTEAL